MEFSYTESTDTSTNMVTKNYSKSRMRENCKYGSVRGGQSNLIPSTRLRGGKGFLRLTAPAALRVLRFDGPMGPRVVVGACGASMNKTFKTGLRPGKTGKPPLRAMEKRSPFGGWRHHLSPASGGTTTRDLLCVTYEIIASRSFIVPPLQRGEGGAVGTKGGKATAKTLHRVFESAKVGP